MTEPTKHDHCAATADCLLDLNEYFSSEKVILYKVLGHYSVFWDNKPIIFLCKKITFFPFLGQPKKLLVKNCTASYLLQICFVRSFELEAHYKQIIFLQLFAAFCSGAPAPTTQLTKNVGKALRLRFQRLLGHPISSEK